MESQERERNPIKADNARVLYIRDKLAMLKCCRSCLTLFFTIIQFEFYFAEFLKRLLLGSACKNNHVYKKVLLFLFCKKKDKKTKLLILHIFITTKNWCKNPYFHLRHWIDVIVKAINCLF